MWYVYLFWTLFFVRPFVRDKNTFKYVNVNIQPYLNDIDYEDTNE